jgi:hypothetical protein
MLRKSLHRVDPYVCPNDSGFAAPFAEKLSFSVVCPNHRGSAALFAEKLRFSDTRLITFAATPPLSTGSY